MKRRALDVACWIGIGIVAVGLAAYGLRSASVRRAEAINADGCLAYRPPPMALAIATDVTDELAPQQPRKWRTSVVAEIGHTPPGTRLMFTTIEARVPAELAFQHAPCKPPEGNGRVVSGIRNQMNQALNVAEEHFNNAKPTDGSAIRATILAIAADPAFRGTGKRVILALTDMLEADGDASVYRHRPFTLPAPVGKPLQNITVRFVVLRNQRDRRLQTESLLRSWIIWIEAAGGRAIVDAPWLGFAPPDEATVAGDEK